MVLLERDFGIATFNSWLSKLKFVRFDDDIRTLIVSVSSRFAKDWITTNYAQDILRLAKTLYTNVHRIEVIVRAVDHEAESQHQTSLSHHVAMTSSDQLIQKNPGVKYPVNEGISMRDGMFEEAGDHMGELGGDVSSMIEAIGAQLDGRFTFDSFVVGKSNELAYAAARRVAESTEAQFNPLFLYGGVGLGKTHLMHAIAWHIKVHQPTRQVLYLSAEKFMYQFIRALRYKNTMSFKELFRNVDVLMVDDVQFISGKDSTQEEFFHTFNALVDKNHQVIVSADKSPSDLEGMEDRLKSRLGWGLVADVHPTTYELRLGILQAKADTMDIHVPKEVMEFLASKVSSNVRELEGALNRVAAQASLVGSAITLENTQALLRDLIKSNERRVSVDDIQKRVAEYYGIKFSEMQSAKRAQVVARPRQIAMYLSKTLTTKSLPEIGRRFGGRDHTTVIHAVRKIEELLDADADLGEDISVLRRSLEH